MSYLLVDLVPSCLFRCITLLGDIRLGMDRTGSMHISELFFEFQARRDEFVRSESRMEDIRRRRRQGQQLDRIRFSTDSWKSLKQSLFRIRSIWDCSGLLQGFWRLDFTEGPDRIRTRLDFSLSSDQPLLASFIRKDSRSRISEIAVESISRSSSPQVVPFSESIHVSDKGDTSEISDSETERIDPPLGVSPNLSAQDASPLNILDQSLSSVVEYSSPSVSSVMDENTSHDGSSGAETLASVQPDPLLQSFENSITTISSPGEMSLFFGVESPSTPAVNMYFSQTGFLSAPHIPPSSV